MKAHSITTGRLFRAHKQDAHFLQGVWPLWLFVRCWGGLTFLGKSWYPHYQFVFHSTANKVDFQLVSGSFGTREMPKLTIAVSLLLTQRDASHVSALPEGESLRACNQKGQLSARGRGGNQGLLAVGIHLPNGERYLGFVLGGDFQKSGEGQEKRDLTQH